MDNCLFNNVNMYLVTYKVHNTDSFITGVIINAGVIMLRAHRDMLTASDMRYIRNYY